jgi:hypothetical protein
LDARVPLPPIADPQISQEMNVYRNKFIHILECWNGEEPDASNVDLVRRFQQPQPLDGMTCRDFYTILIDLRRDQDALLGAIKRDTRYEIRRAASEPLVYDLWTVNVLPVLDEFCDYYNVFASRRKQPPLRRPRLASLAASGSLNLSRVGETEGETLVWHAYHRGQSRMTLLHSASLVPGGATSGRRNKVGRANRFHHWRDLLEFKKAGAGQYDFGGWYEGASDLKLLQINKFKEEFGGQIVREIICDRALTWRGALFLRLKQAMLSRAK